MRGVFRGFIHKTFKKYPDFFLDNNFPAC